MEIKEFTIKPNDEGRTVLKFLEKMLLDVPKSVVERAFRNKDIKVNNIRTNDKTLTLKEGDQVVIYGVEAKIAKRMFAPVQKAFEVVYEDKNILVVNKQINIAVHDEPNCLDNQILNFLKFKQKDSFVPSSIGRLDKVTSGIMVYAKNYATLRELKERQEYFKKIYIFKSDLPTSMTTDFKIMHDEERKREVCGDFGKETKTIFTIEKGKKYAELVTGRKHQIRASLSKLGYPIYGDRRYGGKPADRVFLHSMSVTFKKLDGDLAYLNNMELMCLPNWK